MRIAISLIWIRHKVAGGVESFTRNLLDGFAKDSSDNAYILLCSKDNIDSFAHYREAPRFTIIECPVVSSSLKETLIYESFKLDKFVTSLNADICFVPAYRMPMLIRKNKYVVVIHDLISANFPEMFKWYRRWWLNFATRRVWKMADAVVTISNFVANDLTQRFGATKTNHTIYNPILPCKDADPFENVALKYGIEKGKYFYTVSSIARNKNLFTLLKLMKVLTQNNEYDKYKLVISGVGFSKSAKNRFYAVPFLNFIEENHLKNRCIFTGFVSNEERNALIINCKYFLFPSVFEGFGMPVIEALELGANVITTKCASIPEVSQGKAIYVENPFDEKEWMNKICENMNTENKPVHFREYELETVTKQYLNCFETVWGGQNFIHLIPVACRYIYAEAVTSCFYERRMAA